MIDIEISESKDSIKDKIEKIRFHRLISMISKEIEEYFDFYANYHNRFAFKTVKNDLSEIFDRHDLKYSFEYDYDQYSDQVKVLIGRSFVLNIKFTRESDYHI